MLRSRHILLPVILCLDAIAPLSAQPLGDEADNLYIPPAITVTDDDGREAKIELEEITEEDPPGRKGLGINLHDDECDSFHIYWDPGQDDYDWWRL